MKLNMQNTLKVEFAAEKKIKGLQFSPLTNSFNKHNYQDSGWML